MGKIESKWQSERVVLHSDKACTRFILYSAISVCSKRRRNLISKKSFRWAGNKECWEVCRNEHFQATQSKTLVFEYSIIAEANNFDTVTIFSKKISENCCTLS